MASKKRRANEQNDVEFLLRLSNACTCHGNEVHPNKPLPKLTERDEVPPRCLRDIASLSSILPKVEATFEVEKNPHSAILPHLCDFYQSVVQGRFCPHAPQVFDWGKGGSEVLPRIFYLFQHLASKSISSNALKNREQDPPVCNVICTTIAQMISFLPSETLQECIVRDLIFLSLDLAVIAKVLPTTKSIQVCILGEAIQECKQTNSYMLTFTNMDSLYVVWEGIFSILTQLFGMQRKKRLSLSFEETAESYENMQLPTIHADSNWAFVLENGDLLSTALACMRQVLVSPPKPARGVLVTRCKVSVATLLNTLVDDCKSLSSLFLSQVATLIPRAVQQHFTVIAERQEGQLSTRDDLQLSRLLETLLCSSVVFPPSAAFEIRASALHGLLDCIPLLRQVAKESPFVKDDVSLAYTTLRAIHTVLSTSSGENYPFIATMANHGGIFPTLFSLMQNAHLGNVARQIIVALLSAETSVDVASACRLAQHCYEKEIAATVDSELPNGSKKRARSSQVSPYRPQLRMERSPKRSRSASTSQPTLATPSPPNSSSQASARRSSATAISGGGGSCHEALGSTLLSALLHAKRILGMVDPCRSLFEADKTESSNEITTAIVSVSSILCLLFGLLQDCCNPSIDEQAQPLLQVAGLLAKSIKAVAVSLLSHCQKDGIVDGARRCVDCIIRVGLEGQFAVGRALVEFPKVHRDTTTECLDAITLCAREVWGTYARAQVAAAGEKSDAEMQLDTADTMDSKSNCCCGTCSKLNCMLACHGAGSEHDWLPCLCKLIQMPVEFDPTSMPASSGRSQRFQSDCTMSILERLTTRERCALLTSLRPLLSGEDMDNTIISHPMGDLCSPSSSSKQGLRTTPEMLSLSPLFELSSVLATLEKENARGIAEGSLVDTNGGAQSGTAPLAHDLVRTLSSSLGRVMYGKYLDAISKSTESTLSAASYAAVDRIHELSDLTLRVAADSSDTSPDKHSPFLGEILSNPLSVLSFILGCRFSSALTASIEDGQRRPRDSLYESVEATYRSRRIAFLSTCSTGVDDLSSDTRIVKWKSLSNTCLRSSVNEMAQIRSRLSASALRRQRAKMEETLGFDADESFDEGDATKNPLVWLLRSAFADESDSVRFCAAQNVGRILSSNKSSLLYALFSTATNWRRRDVSEFSLQEEVLQRSSSMEHVIIPLFLEIDRLLCRYCHVPQSQLSFTMGPSVISDRVSTVTSKDGSRMLPFQRSAVMALSSICEHADVDSPCGILVFENALARLIRLWTADNSDSLDGADGSASISAIAFHEIVRLNELRSFRDVLFKNSYERFVPRLFSDVLLSSGGMISNTGTADAPSSLERENRERHFGLLLKFIGSFLLPAPEKPECQIKAATTYGSYCMHCVEEFLDEVIASVLSAFISVKDHDSLLAVIGFKLFVIAERRKVNKAAKKAARSAAAQSSGRLSDDTLGHSARTVSAKNHGIDASSRELAEQTKLQCLAPDMIEELLPRMLMANDRSQLLFFLEVVLQKKCSLHQMISSRHLLILKTIVSEFGRTGDVAGAEHALRAAAKGRENASMSYVPGSSGSKQGDDNALVNAWVTSGFMYILVNVVQLHWKTRTLLDRIHGLRSLKWVLKFLSPAEAPQYLPQIMATVNMAMGGESSSSGLESGTWRLRLLAIQALSDFIRTAIQSQYEMIGSNLATIVVSLFPVLSVDASTVASENERRTFTEASKVAVDLLEWLTQGSNGQNLASYFQDIPFLPPTKSLDKVREALKAHGVTFDNLQVFSATQNTQSAVVGSLTSDGGTSNSDERKESAPTHSASSCAALRKRLHTVEKLLSHENVNVRRVVLQHLIDTLRANRALFHRLVESEEGSSLNRFVTISSDSDSSNGSVASIVDSLLQVCCSEADFEARQLLATCLGEVGAIGPHHLGEATVKPLQSKEAGDDSSLWRLKQAPWQSRPVRYELRVVTKHLVVALKAATSSGDQHKIAFSIQQLLVLLDEHAKMGSRSDSNLAQLAEKPARNQMSDWLREQLSGAGVIETLEPFWCSKFNETEQFSTKEPPFFSVAGSYFAWLSYWCRHMLKRSNDDGRNQWCSFFYACRTAIRSKAGMPLAEFVIPLLVLDRICNGNGMDERSVINEFLGVFEFGENSERNTGKMSHAERRKAVNCAFMVLDTLQHWAEVETEERYYSSRVSSARSARRKRDEENNETESTCWLWEESVSAIDRLLKAVPLSLQANAAASVGMHARALRLMEMAARAELVEPVYDSQANEPAKSKSKSSDQSPGGQKLIGTLVDIDSVDTKLFKRVLGELNDCETMEGIANTSDVASSARDDIMIKESKGQWSGALYDYERALELDEAPNNRSELEQGSLRCLLELGQLESVLNQANGLIHSQREGTSSSNNDLESVASANGSRATPYAVEAAWRLGRWSTLTQILNDFENKDVKERSVDSDGVYRMSLGKAMHGLYERSEPEVVASIRKARHVLMSDLSNVARDSYSRSYPYLVRLHCLREVENVREILFNPDVMADHPRLGDVASSSSADGWNWNDRLAVVSRAESSDVMDVRLALSRLTGDNELQGSLYLAMGKKARKSGLINVAANFLSQADACCSRQRSNVDVSSSSVSHVDDLLSSIRLQSAKLKHQSGESTAALRMLGLGNVTGMLDNDDKTMQSLALSHERNAIPGYVMNGRDQAADINRFSRRLLQSTRWMVEGGIKGGSEVIERFHIVQRLSPQWEKGYFQFAKYIDSVLESRISAFAHRLGKSGQLSVDDDATRQAVILQDEHLMKYLVMAMQQYISALRFDSKHVYQALPRLLSLWFDFTSYQAVDVKQTQSIRIQSTAGDLVARYQMDANDIMATKFKTIPAHCLYTALPQLISRVSHRNEETAMVVRSILARVLTKHPAQAMWSLAWLLHSADKKRVAIGDEIFKGAQSSLLKRKENKSRSLLIASKSLFKYLIDIAKYEPKEGNSRSFSVKNWRGEAELVDFIPPVQEALSVSPSAADGGNFLDAFPMMVPRIRAFCSKVQIMQSKAKPKKVKAFVVPADQPRRSRASTASGSNRSPQSGDIGEMHFLVKQEAKGDLRKDARVQNLNNVINRLLAASNSSGTGGSSRQQRRLHLRTFAVTCLSEDCGVLEWVPNTDSMRNLVMRSYNPQASPFSVKRRGKRLGNYGDNMSLKSAFEKCQAVFFKNGNLLKAASMFEEACLKPYPPLLYWYFVQHFMDPHSWYEARTQFTLSCAAWSAVGHVIGLGDRHSENILVDTSSGQCVHVDFDCIFDKGLLLPKPEVVPFRLSPNMIDAFGPIGADGVYTGGIKAAMTTLRSNRDTLLSVLEPFTKDPIIDWKRLKSSQRGSSSISKTSDQRSLQAKKSITTIDERLKGIYNLRNPNYKKVRRTDGWSQDADDEMMHMLPLSVEGQVHKMITEATSHENLVQLYCGWMPWV